MAAIALTLTAAEGVARDVTDAAEVEAIKKQVVELAKTSDIICNSRFTSNAFKERNDTYGLPSDNAKDYLFFAKADLGGGGKIKVEEFGDVKTIEVVFEVKRRGMPGGANAPAEEFESTRREFYRVTAGGTELAYVEANSHDERLLIYNSGNSNTIQNRQATICQKPR